jgi:hypothetical protein
MVFGATAVTEEVKRIFPRLKTEDFEVIGGDSPFHNCVGDVLNTLGQSIPDPARRLQSAVNFFEKKGWGVCENGDLELGLEKLAIYVDTLGRWTHVCLGMPDGRWRHKCGLRGRILTQSARSLEGQLYGTCLHFMMRKSELPAAQRHVSSHEPAT